MRSVGDCRNRLLLWCFACFFLFLGCGKKGPPAIPRAVVPPPVRDLRAALLTDHVRLTWTIPKKGDEIFEGIERFRVLKHKEYDFESRCRGCPLRFDAFFDIRLKYPLRGRVEGDRVICYDRVEAGYRYSYKVVVYHKSGGVSKGSYVVSFIVPD